MTPAGQDYPTTALDLLFGPAADAPAALARQILSADRNLGRSLENLPKATREAAVREASTTAPGLLKVDLIGVLVTGWREHRDITSAARRTLAAPGSSELVSLAEHQVTMAQQPSVNVLVDGHRVATLRLGLSIVFDVNALLAGISGGRLVAIHSGRCDITVTLAVQDTEVLVRRGHLELPGVMGLKEAVRLLPASEYPGSKHLGRAEPTETDDPPPPASAPWWERVGPVTRPGRRA